MFNDEDVEKIKTYMERRREKEDRRRRMEEIKRSLNNIDLAEYDELANDSITRKDKIMTCVFAGLLFLASVPLIVVSELTLSDKDFCSDEDIICLGKYQLPVNILLFFTIFMILGLLTGLLTIKKEVNIGYTRKTLHFCSFFLPYGVNKILPSGGNILLILMKFWIILAIFLLLTKWLRRALVFPLIIFRSFDRPEDRPYTTVWLVTQFIATGIVLAAFGFLWHYLGASTDNLALILVLIVGIGDGLAEPVGIKFGKHKYKARAIYFNGKFCGGEFTRSFEGSFVVYIVSIIVIAIFYTTFTKLQFIIAIFLIPIIATLSEAFAPRTWDNPFIILVCGIVLTCIILIPDVKF